MMTTPSLPPDEYETGDLGTAAFLTAKEFPLLRVERGERNASFVFPGSARSVAGDFYRPGGNLVDARKFHVLLRQLRGLARGDRR